MVPEPDMLIDPDIPSTCGIHNPNGISNNGITVKIQGISSQEGEWPHTCLILKVDEQGLSKELVGGASLIAPKVIITAAHKVG